LAKLPLASRFVLVATPHHHHLLLTALHTIEADWTREETKEERVITISRISLPLPETTTIGIVVGLVEVAITDNIIQTEIHMAEEAIEAILILDTVVALVVAVIEWTAIEILVAVTPMLQEGVAIMVVEWE
jgi:hypothetical protein